MIGKNRSWMAAYGGEGSRLRGGDIGKNVAPKKTDIVEH